MLAYFNSTGEHLIALVVACNWVTWGFGNNYDTCTYTCMHHWWMIILTFYIICIIHNPSMLWSLIIKTWKSSSQYYRFTAVQQLQIVFTTSKTTILVRVLLLHGFLLSCDNVLLNSCLLTISYNINLTFDFTLYIVATKLYWSSGMLNTNYISIHRWNICNYVYDKINNRITGRYIPLHVL